MDLAGASGPGGINSVHSHMRTHTKGGTLERTHAMLSVVPRQCSVDNDGKSPPPRPPTHTQAESDRLMRSVIQCVLHTHTHEDQCLNRCVPTSELLLSTDISSCTYDDGVCMCMHVCVHVCEPQRRLLPHRSPEGSSAWHVFHKMWEFIWIHDHSEMILWGWSQCRVGLGVGSRCGGERLTTIIYTQ